MQTRPSRRVFALSGSGVAASRKWSRARSGFRAQRESCTRIARGATGQATGGNQQPSSCASRARPMFSLSDSSNAKPSDAGRVSLRSCLARAKIQWEERPMAIVRNIEVIAQSPNGFDDACREAIREASKTLRGISSFWIKNAEVRRRERSDHDVSRQRQDQLFGRGSLAGAAARVSRRICRPAFGRVLLFRVLGLAASRNWSRARGPSAHRVSMRSKSPG